MNKEIRNRMYDLLSEEKYIPRSEMVDGQYYLGNCNNSHIAVWSGSNECFYKWRTKIGQVFVESICHNEDDADFDTFKPVLMYTPEDEDEVITIPETGSGDDQTVLISID